MLYDLFRESIEINGNIFANLVNLEQRFGHRLISVEQNVGDRNWREMLSLLVAPSNLEKIPYRELTCAFKLKLKYEMNRIIFNS